MYDHIKDELVDSGISTEREVETRMDIGKNIVQEKNALCCKVTHNIDEPDWVLVMDEVGGNTNQKAMLRVLIIMLLSRGFIAG